MLSFLRTVTPRSVTAHQNPVIYEDGRAYQKFHSPSQQYMVTDLMPATTTEHGRSYFNPPLHFHMYQTEDFEVISGVGRWWLDGETILLKKGEKIHIPMNAFHRFENASEDGEGLVVSFRLDKQDWEMEERFFRNFFGYLEDVKKAGQEPSIFQIMLFLYSVHAPPVLPGIGQKSTFVGRQLSWFFMAVMGVVVGQWLLGYQITYPEYYNPEGQKKTA